MKDLSGLKRIGSIAAMLSIISLSFLISACLKTDSENLQNQENEKISSLKLKFKFTESDALGNGIYLHYRVNTGDTISRPVVGNTVIVTYKGLYSQDDDTVAFDATNAAVAREANIFDSSFVYGPTRIRVGYTLLGISVALEKMSKNDVVAVLIPSEYAYMNYQPVVYIIKLMQIITNDSTYEISQRNQYARRLGFTDTVSSPLKGTYTKYDVSTNDTAVRSGDTVLLNIYGYYAEVESFLPDTIGREFYPLNGYSGDYMLYTGTTDVYPITPAIDSTVLLMRRGEIREIITSSENTYGAYGYLSPKSYYVVPPYMSLHYKIEVKKINNVK